MSKIITGFLKIEHYKRYQGYSIQDAQNGVAVDNLFFLLLDITSPQEQKAIHYMQCYKKHSI